MSDHTLARRSPLLLDPARLGIWMFLAAVAMLFAAFASAYVVRMASSDWATLRLPFVLWLNTVVLVASSACLETARQRPAVGAGRWLGSTVLLGALFLVGQVVAWRDLIGQGVLVPTSPHGAFFYILTGMHGLHLVAGLLYLVYVWRSVRHADSERAAWLQRQAATYWHFMGGLWVFLFAVLHLG
jgi:cytochrome c oxidase subunit 3